MGISLAIVVLAESITFGFVIVIGSVIVLTCHSNINLSTKTSVLCNTVSKFKKLGHLWV